MTQQHNLNSPPPIATRSKTVRLALVGTLVAVGCLLQGAALANNALKPAYTLSDAALYQPKPLAPEAITAAEKSVQVEAVVQKSPPQITLNWVVDPYAEAYTITRKSLTDTVWSAPIFTVFSPSSASAISFVDTNVVVGTGYEYQVIKFGNKPGTGTTTYNAYGYVYSGIELPVNDDRGHILILVDNFVSTAIQTELDQLKEDLVGDGYQVIVSNVPRANVLEDWSKRDGVTSTKQIILNAWNTYSPTLKSVYLLGHIPVPYSGVLFYPDGQFNHHGAWPADVYYADMSNSGWTDSGIGSTDTSAMYLPQVNNLNDGKYAQSAIPNPVRVQIGRVDFYSTISTTVQSEMLANESNYLRQYLNRVHSWRFKTFTAQTSALVDDGCESTYLGSVADGENAYRNFAPLVGASNVISANWTTTLNSANYLWAFGCGTGNAGNDPDRWRTISGIGNTQDLLNTNAAAAFNLLCGQYVGDWNSQYGGDFLRAPLATTRGLASMWTCRPHWFMHHMGMGLPIGYSTLRTQSNIGVNGFHQPVETDAGKVHIALMGDPTLRMHVVQPAINVGYSVLGPGAVRITWNASPDATHGYHVYRAASKLGQYTRLTTLPVVGTTYDDSGLVVGTYYYMVRPVKLETSPSGSYFNLGQGTFSDAVEVNSSGEVFTPTPTPTTTATPPSGGGGGTGTPNPNTPTPGGPTPTSPGGTVGPTPTGTLPTPGGTSIVTPDLVTRTPAPKINCAKSFCVAMPVVRRQ